MRTVTIKTKQFEKIKELVEAGIFFSLSEIVRFSLFLYFEDSINPRNHIFYYKNIGKTHQVSFKMQLFYYERLEYLKKHYCVPISKIISVALDIGFAYADNFLKQPPVLLRQYK